jgi:hypothetical protein
VTARELHARVQGQREAQSGEEVLRGLGPLSPERVRQEAVEHDQAQAVGRGREERREGELGYRTGEEAGARKTAAGVRRVPGPQMRGWEDP